MAIHDKHVIHPQAKNMKVDTGCGAATGRHVVLRGPANRLLGCTGRRGCTGLSTSSRPCPCQASSPDPCLLLPAGACLPAAKTTSMFCCVCACVCISSDHPVAWTTATGSVSTLGLSRELIRCMILCQGIRQCCSHRLMQLHGM